VRWIRFLWNTVPRSRLIGAALAQWRKRGKRLWVLQDESNRVLARFYKEDGSYRAEWLSRGASAPSSSSPAVPSRYQRTGELRDEIQVEPGVFIIEIVEIRGEGIVGGREKVPHIQDEFIKRRNINRSQALFVQAFPLCSY
jgi:hypothetical protein